MAVWVIVTTSLINQAGKGRDYETRKTEYIAGINIILNLFKGCKVVIVENQSIRFKKFSFGTHRTFLDSFGIPVLYTKTNEIDTKNYGLKELLDINACIRHFNIPDDDFIVKVTGRYYLNEKSNFIKEVKNLDQTRYDAIIRYGKYFNPPQAKTDNCITGLIGLKCKYIKEIELPDNDTFVEQKWAEKVMLLDDSKVCILNELGIYIRPCLQQEYFLV